MRGEIVGDNFVQFMEECVQEKRKPDEVKVNQATSFLDFLKTDHCEEICGSWTCFHVPDLFFGVLQS